MHPSKRVVLVLFTLPRDAILRTSDCRSRETDIGNLRPYGYKAVPLSLNALSARTAALIVSIGFDRRFLGKQRWPIVPQMIFFKAYLRAGLMPYRLGLEQGCHLPQMSGPWPDIFCAMQRILDPSGCMAASRYEPLWRKDRPRLQRNPEEKRTMHFLGRKRVAVITAMGLAAPGALDPESFWRKVRNWRNGHRPHQTREYFGVGMFFWRRGAALRSRPLPPELKPKRLARHTQLVLWAAHQIKAEVEATAQESLHPAWAWRRVASHD